MTTQPYVDKLACISRPRPLTLVIGSLLAGVAPGTSLAATPADPALEATATVQFDDNFFTAGGRRTTRSMVDVARFEQGNVVLPGAYKSDVKLNGEWKGRMELSFKEVQGSRGGQLCFDRMMLSKLGVDLSRLDAEAAAPNQAGEHKSRAPIYLGGETVCSPLGLFIPGASTQANEGGLVVDFTIPQLYLARKARGYVNPELWDKGITAGLVGYNFNYYRSSSRGREQDNAYLGLNLGFNAGMWRLRHQGNLSYNSLHGINYQAQRTYAQRDIDKLQSTLTVGDTFTSGEHFDSIPVRGLTLQTLDQMLPQSRTGYAPVVRGVAETNARVTVRQNGQLLYETTVAPGPFEIDDLNPTGYGGDLAVVVHEADGRERGFNVPYAATAQLVREGYTRYAATLGQTRQQGLEPQAIVQATVQHGLNNHVTGYAGSVALPHYFAAQIGGAVSTRAGAFSLDVTHANAKQVGPKSRHGLSTQVRYNKNITELGTNVALGAYRYSTSGYLGVSDAMQLRRRYFDGQDASQYSRARSRFELSFNQTLGQGRGALFVNGSTTSYWGSKLPVHTYSVGYNNSWRQLSFNLNAQRTRDLNRGGKAFNEYYASVYMPLGGAPRSPNLNISFNRSEASSSNQVQSGISGIIGEKAQISYGASMTANTAGHSGNDGQRSFNGNVGFNLGQADIVGSYSRGQGYRSVSAGATGTLLAHGGGITLGRGTLPETLALVHAQDAEGAMLNNGAQINKAGYALLPNLVPYRLNDIHLDPKGTSRDLQLETTTQTATPRMGAVVLLRYATSNEPTLMFVAKDAAGKSLPFGAEVIDEEGNSLGVVAQASRIILRGLKPDQNKIIVKWGDDTSKQCFINISPKATTPERTPSCLARKKTTKH